MIVASFLSNSGNLNREIVLNAVPSQIVDGPINWLSEAEAAEIVLTAYPTDLNDIWENLQAQSIDFNILNVGDTRRKQLLIADMDGTLIRQECIDELAREIGEGERVKEITERAMNGGMNFEEALTQRLALLKDHPISIIPKILSTRIDITPGARALAATMKRHGAHCVIVSGGFTDFAKSICETLDFDAYHANRLEHENGLLTGRVLPPIIGKDKKVEILQNTLRHQGIRVENTIAVGDGANDLGMLDYADIGVAFHAKPLVQRQSNIRINHHDLSALLFLQGYRKEEIFEA